MPGITTTSRIRARLRRARSCPTSLAAESETRHDRDCGPDARSAPGRGSLHRRGDPKRFQEHRRPVPRRSWPTWRSVRLPTRRRDREIIAVIAYLQRLGTDIKGHARHHPTSSPPLNRQVNSMISKHPQITSAESSTSASSRCACFCAVFIGVLFWAFLQKEESPRLHGARRSRSRARTSERRTLA